MADVLQLLIWSSIMTVSSFIAGLIPISISLSSKQLKIITQLGTGILIGTAFIIIIPEGVALLPPSDTNIIGSALILGFAIMYLLDRLPLFTRSTTSPSSLSSSDLHPIPLEPTSSIANTDTDTLLDPPPTSLKPNLTSTSQLHQHSNTTTLGLTIHAFTDGIALGASSTAPASVSLLIFAAIMIHKAPVAFGLCTTLLAQGIGRRAIRSHLLWFSLAAPAGALVTWAVVRTLAGRAALQGSFAAVQDGQGDAGRWTGGAMVFSGGTFLYVAMHALSDGEKGAGAAGDVLWTLGGMLLPLLARFSDHGHEH